MASTTETKQDDRCGGRRHGPPTEEERRQREAEFKQEFLDEYKKRHGDALISAEQTWELYQAVEERWHAKMKQRRSSPPHHDDRSSSSPHQGDRSPHRGGPRRFEEKRKEVHAELQQEFQKDFATSHGTNTVNIDQAWALIQKVQQGKREKWQANREKHGHGHGHGCGHGHSHGSGDRGRQSPPANQ